MNKIFTDLLLTMGAGHHSVEIMKQISNKASQDYKTKPKTATSNKCKAPNCSQKHDKHFCKNCKDIDADHKSKYCPHAQKSLKTNNKTTLASCKVLECSEQHESHFCKICQDKDSDHYATNCPQGIILYHGTKLQYALKIMKEGFKPTKGRQGDVAVYFTDEFEIAAKCGQRIKHSNSSNGDFAVIKCTFKGDSQNLEKRIHPAWTKDNISDKPFNQFLIKADHLKHLKIFKIIELTN